jgi:hypothetical protein
MVDKSTVGAFTSGVHNRVDGELVPKDAATDSLNWMTKDGRIELSYGRQALGTVGSGGRVLALHTGYKTDGTTVFFRKIWNGSDGIIQYLNGTTWTNIVTGLSNTAMTFSNYSSLAGNFVFATSPDDGLFYIVTANPASYASLYDSSKNFKGYSTIDKGRMFMWGTTTDKTGLYGSYIDKQNSTVYTTVTGEAITAVESGTLAFKAGGATRSCFAVVITDTSSGEVFTADYTGVLTGSLGGSGTINFMTGAFTITGQTGAGTANYQYWSPNVKGVTDFTKSGTRLAGEGFIVRQDAGGDPIKVVIPFEGSYFSLKERSVYQFTLDAADTSPRNELIRTNVGVATLGSAVSTSVGIVFLNTGNASDPRITIIQRNPYGDNFTTNELFEQFDFSDYTYDDAFLESWDTFVVVACRKDSDTNNRLLLCDMTAKSVDVSHYEGRCFAKDEGLLYSGDTVTTTVYELFTGFDDMGQEIDNYWIGAVDNLGTDTLKRVKKMRFRGNIAPDQELRVYIATDSGVFTHVGTILGSGDYVDYTATYAIGTTFIGQTLIGAGPAPTVYSFFAELKIKVGKFRVRQVKFVASGMGYCNVQMVEDHDVWQYQNKMPVNYRVKQNVSIDGETTDLDNPEY